MRSIRVGMIRCDTHACWYGLLFAPFDEGPLLEYESMCHYYFLGAHALRFDTVPGLELTRVWDEDRRNAEKLAKIFRNEPKICSSLEEVSDDVDLVFIADCMGEGKDHLALATPGLKKGVPTFVDKPFAYTLADALSLVALAKANNTPLTSSSLLRRNPLIDRFHRRFEEIDPVGMGVVKGVGVWKEHTEETGLDAVYHGLSLAQHVFGEGVEWVECMGTRPLEFVHLHYPIALPPEPIPSNFPKQGIEVLVISSHLPSPYCGFRCEVYSYNHEGVLHSPWINDYKHPFAGQVILRMLKDMVRTRKPPIRYESILELMEIVEAARGSQETGKPVALAGIREL